MPIQAYIIFNGNCRKALQFYEEVFNGKAQVMLYKEAPPSPEFSVPPEAADLVMHAEMSIAGSRVMFCDTLPGSPFTAGNNIYLTIMSSDVEEIRSIYERLKEGGKVDMELQETFWTRSFAMLTDKYGINWQLSYFDQSSE